MTKIKNTKKGMAKKTLSISLAVAMLATSNVPVWAAEFTDGTDAAFTSEAVVETPVEEVVTDAEEPVVEEEVDVQEGKITEASDLVSTDVVVSKSADFGTGKVGVSGKVYIKKDGELEELKDYSFGWRVKGQTDAIFTDKIAADNTTAKMAFKPEFANVGTTNDHSGAKDVDWSKYVGKELELYIFNNLDSTDAMKIDPTVIGTTVINKCEIKGTLQLNKGAEDLVYNGKEYFYTDDEKFLNDANAVMLKQKTSDGATTLTVTGGDAAPGNSVWNKHEVLKYFDVNATKTAKNAKEVLKVTATAKADSPYSGTISATPYVIQQRTFNANEFEFTVDDGLSFAYTGNHDIVIPTEKVHFKEKDTLSGADLSSAIKKVMTVSGAIGTTTVRYTFDADKMPNFKSVPSTEQTSSDTEKVTVTKRDLKDDCVVTVTYGKVKYGTKLEDLAKQFTFKGKDGTILTLKNQKEVPANPDYNIKVVNKRTGNEVQDTLNSTDTYTVTITAYENPSTQTGTCVNGQSFDIEVSDDVLTSATYLNTEYKPVYTGAAIEPSADNFGALELNGSSGKETVAKGNYKITGYKNNTNAATYKDDKQKTWAYATVEILKGKYDGETFDVPFTILPLEVSEDTVTVPKTVSINKGYNVASDYKVPLVITAKDTVNGTVVKGLAETDYSIKYEFVDKDGKEGRNDLHYYIKATITIKNPNFMGENGSKIVVEMPKDDTDYRYWTEIVEKAITNDMIKINPTSYTYTGGNITPNFVVMDGAIVLYDKDRYGEEKGEYEIVSITGNKDVGENTGKVTVKGIEGKYSGTASATFSITPANTADVKVEFTNSSECNYTGEQVRPRTFKATLNGNDVTSQFQIVDYGKNISGKGTVELRTVDGNKNFTGNNITAEFNIVKEVVKADIKIYNDNGTDVTSDYAVTDEKATNFSGSSFDFDGATKEFKTALLKNITKVSGGFPQVGTTATADDFEIKYVDNVAGKNTGMKDSKGNRYNIAYVYAVAKDGTGYAGPSDAEHTIVTADGTIIKNVVAKMAFAIKNVAFDESNVYVTNASYAGGLPVKPNVLVQINGNTLVEGKDYTVKVTDKSNKDIVPIEVTDGKIYKVVVTGINGYAGSEAGKKKEILWGVDKKDLKDCDVKVVNGVAYVMNGYIPVPVTEYTVKENDDKTYTVTANKDSKNYTGSKTVVAEGQKPTDKPDAPMIQSVKVVGNKATVILSGETEGAVGYDYVISTDKDCINNKDYDKVNKNILNTTTDFTYVGQDVYYAYCHAWKRGEDGKKIFSDWSNAYPFVVSAITPSQPAITSVKVKGSTVTVTYTKSSNADGYDVVLGSKVATVAGEKRPVEYGTLVKKNIKGNTVTATFKNVKKGTYYAGLHAFNRTSEDGKKVFSPWSNVKKVTVK